MITNSGYTPFYPDKIWMERRVRSSPVAEEIVSHLPEVPIEWIDDINHTVSSRNTIQGKNILVLAKQEGQFLKPCPGTKNYVCCNYYFLNLSTNCDINCTYCILQGYLNNPYMTVYTNLNEMYSELHNLFLKNKDKFYRIGTGELTDSLTLDHITGYSTKLIPFFLNYPNAILELKTKTDQIENLLQFSPEKKVIVSWSLNPDQVIEKEEKNAPGLQKRLEAARVCSRAGYLIGFHLDPLIHYPDWEQGYREVVSAIFQAVPADQIVWISLGALRYPKDMDRIVRENHPDSDIVLGELFPGKDGKLRYFRPVREKMFNRLVQWIREESKHVQIYLCMESPEVWHRSFGHQPLVQCSFPGQLDRSVFRCRNGA